MIGYIYRLTSEHCDKVYIGSTEDMERRFSVHKSNYKRWKNGSEDYCSSFILFELGSVTMGVIEEFEFENRSERYLKERHYIENNECVNKNIPGRNKKEWLAANKEQIKVYQAAYHSAYYAANTAQISIQKAAYYAANKEQLKIKMAAYQAANKEQLKIKMAAHYAANKEQLKIKMAAHYAENKEQLKIKRAARKAAAAVLI